MLLILDEQFDGHSKGVIDVDGVLGARFEIRRIVIVSTPDGRLFVRHLTIWQVDFVSQDDDWKIVRITHVGVVEKLLFPHRQVLEALRVVDAEREETAVGSAIEGRSEALESFLAGRVPDLERVHFAVDAHVLVEKFDADRVERLAVEFVAHESLH